MKTVNVKSHTRKGYCVPKTKVSSHTRRVRKSNSKPKTKRLSKEESDSLFKRRGTKIKNKTVVSNKNTLPKSSEEGSLRAPVKILFNRNSKNYDNLTFTFATAGNSIKYDTIKNKIMKTKTFPPANKNYTKAAFIRLLDDSDIFEKPVTSAQMTINRYPKIVNELKNIINSKNIRTKKKETLFIGVAKFF